MKNFCKTAFHFNGRITASQLCDIKSTKEAIEVPGSPDLPTPVGIKSPFIRERLYNLIFKIP